MDEIRDILKDVNVSSVKQFFEMLTPSQFDCLYDTVLEVEQYLIYRDATSIIIFDSDFEQILVDLYKIIRKLVLVEFSEDVDVDNPQIMQQLRKNFFTCIYLNFINNTYGVGDKRYTLKPINLNGYSTL